MVEVLLTVFILLISLLGLAALQLKVANANVESYQRTQALVLLEDMVERFNASRKLQTCFNVTTLATGVPYLGQDAGAGDPNLLDVSTGSSFPCASTGVASVDANARIELAAWDRALKGSSEVLAGNAAGALRGARGCVNSDTATDGSGMLVYTVAVAWQGTDAGVAPSNACAAGTYGADDTFRRVVWTTVRVAGLN